MTTEARDRYNMPQATTVAQWTTSNNRQSLVQNLALRAPSSNPGTSQDYRIGLAENLALVKPNVYKRTKIATNRRLSDNQNMAKNLALGESNGYKRTMAARNYRPSQNQNLANNLALGEPNVYKRTKIDTRSWKIAKRSKKMT